MGPVVIRDPPIVLPDGQREPQQRVLIEPIQAEQIPEHVDGALYLLVVPQVEGIEVVVVHAHHVPRNALYQYRLVLFLRAGVVVTQHLQSYPVFLFRSSDFVVELGVVQG